MTVASTPIKQRLENWGKCQHGGAGGGVMRTKETRSGHGGGGYQCMTGVVCNMMKMAANGPAGSSRNRSNLDHHDAAVIERAWVRLPIRPKMMLRLCYVLNSSPEYICRTLNIRRRPAADFIEELRLAERAIEDMLDNVGNR